MMTQGYTSNNDNDNVNDNSNDNDINSAIIHSDMITVLPKVTLLKWITRAMIMNLIMI